MPARHPFSVSYTAAQLEGRIAKQWDTEIVPQLVEYVRIPAKSPHFDPQWREAGHIEAAVQQARAWLAVQPVTGLEIKVARLEERTPVLYFDIPATPGGGNHTVLLYGH